MTWEVKTAIRGTKNPSLVCWSPNGLYLAVADNAHHQLQLYCVGKDGPISTYAFYIISLALKG